MMREFCRRKLGRKAGSDGAKGAAHGHNQTHFGEVQERMVVKTYKETEVTLVDRSGLTYPTLVGRNFLQGHFIVDPSVSYKTSPQCRGPGK
jgi:hypothetical protein